MAISKDNIFVDHGKDIIHPLNFLDKLEALKYNSLWLIEIMRDYCKRNMEISVILREKGLPIKRKI